MRSLILLILLAFFALPACASEKQFNAEKSQSIKTATDAIARSTPRSRTSRLYGGTLNVYGDLQNPDRLETTLGYPNSKIVNNYYFLNGVLARATTQRFELTSINNTLQYKPTPFYTYDVIFYNDQIIGRQSTGSPGDTATIEPEFPDRIRIDDLLKVTRDLGPNSPN
jgi:hypothetical protein